MSVRALHAVPRVDRDAARRVVVLLRKLDVGGAERQIIEFAKGCSGSHVDLTIVSFYDGGELLETATGIAGVRCVSLHKRGRWETLSFLVRAWRTVRALRPDVVYGYQTIANELSLLVGKLVGARVVAYEICAERLVAPGGLARAIAGDSSYLDP